MGDVITFPLEHVQQESAVPITCMDCSHVYAGVRGLFCGFFSESIIYEDIAQECSEFDPL